MTTLALDFTAMMSAAAAQHLDELAAKDARIAQLEAQNAAMADELDRVWSRCERLTNARDSLKTRVAALDALVSERAVAAEQQAFDDLRGSVIAEEAYAAAAAAAQAEPVLDLTGESEGEHAAAQAEPVIDLTGEDAPAAAQGAAAAVAPKRKAALGTLAWMAYVKHVKATQPEALLGAAKECEKLMVIKGIRAEDPEGYKAFVAAWNEEHKCETSSSEDAPAAQGGAAAAAEAKPASRAYQGNLIWWAYVAAMRVKYAHKFVDMPMADQVSIIAELKNHKPKSYAAFGEAWKKEHPGEGLVPMDEDQRKKAIAAAAKRSRQRNKANVGGAANA